MRACAQEDNKRGIVFYKMSVNNPVLNAMHLCPYCEKGERKILITLSKC